MKRTNIWFDGRCLKNDRKILSLIYNSQFEWLLINHEMIKVIEPPRKMKLIVQVNEEKELYQLPMETVILSECRDVLRQADELGYMTALYKRIVSKEDMELAWQAGSLVNYLVVELMDETNIPLELLIARLQNRDTTIIKRVNTVQDAEIAFGVMETGSDGVLLNTEDIKEILTMNEFMGKKELGKLELVKGKVIDVQYIGMGYRACIDTTSLMKENEGMIIGSTSNGGLLVSSETHYLPYMELRPFRVNAGAVHSYAWTPGGATAYLTELKGGSKVLCVDTEGNTRKVSVGRIKIELRPLMKIEVEAMKIRVNAIVQDDWHIRIFGGDGQVRNASLIHKGDELLTYICQGGRHVGIKIDETIEER